MSTSKQYRAQAAEYTELGKTSDASGEVSDYKDLARSYTTLAENEEWLESNSNCVVRAPDTKPSDDNALAPGEEHILRCLGAAVIMQWNNIPKKLQRELFDNAGSMDVLDTKALRGNIARFLHKHKDDER